MALHRTSCSPGGGFYAEGALSAVGAGEEVVPASDYRALQHCNACKKTLETEILREALDLVQPKNGCCAHPRPVGTCHEDGGRYPWRGTLEPGSSGCAGEPQQRRGRRPEPDAASRQLRLLFMINHEHRLY